MADWIGCSRRTCIGQVALLTLAVLLIWSGSFTAVPQFDDHSVVFGDAGQQTLRDWWAAMPGIRPLTKLSWVIDHELGGGSWFRSTNLLLHLACVLLVWRLAAVWLQDSTAAFATAFLFAAHPAHTEAVMLLSARSMLLMTMFCLAATLAHLSGRRWITLFCSGLALLCRETAIMLPVLLWLVSAWREGPRAAFRQTRLHWLLSSGALVVFFLLPRYRSLLETSLALRTPLENLVTQAGGAAWLLRQWMMPIELSADPDLPVFSQWNAGWIILVVIWAILVTLALRGVMTRSSAAFALLWFMIVIAPAHSLMPRIDVANERILYPAAIGFCLLAGTLFARIRESSPRLGTTVTGALLIVCAFLTMDRIEVYRSEVGFWTDASRKSPERSRVWNNLGFAHEHAQEARLEESLEAYERALALDPRDYKAWFNRERVCARLAGLDQPCQARGSSLH